MAVKLTNEEFLSRVRDKVGEEYAQENGIPLIVIKFDEDVDEVLSSKLIPR